MAKKEKEENDLVITDVEITEGRPWEDDCADLHLVEDSLGKYVVVIDVFRKKKNYKRRQIKLTKKNTEKLIRALEACLKKF